MKSHPLNSHPSRLCPRACFQKALATLSFLWLGALCLGTMAPMSARADFSGYYPPVNWDPIYTVSDDPAPGTPSQVDTSGAPGAITLWAQQGYMWSGGTSFYLIPVPVSGTLAFDWEYTADVSYDSSAGYAVNPAIAGWGYAGQWDNPGGHPGCTNLAGRNSSNTGNNTTGHVSITVNAGDMIGFWVHNAFYNAAARFRISNFSAPNGIYHPITSSVGAGGGGKISPLGTVIAPHGLNRTFTMAPSHGFLFGDVLVDGASVGAVASYTFTNVTTDGRTIEAQFTSLPRYTIVPAASAGGTINPSTTVTLYEGDSQAFTITPDSFFDVFSVILDAATAPADVTAGPAAQTYTVASVAVNHTIDATFVEWVSSEIAGTVTSGGSPLEGVQITVAGNRGPFTATTGLDGKYAIRVRPDDTYTVTAAKVGFIASPASLTAGTGDLTGKDFTLAVNPPHLQPMFVNRGTGGWRNDTWTIGSRIHTGASTVYVTKLGYVDRDQNGFNVTHQVGIWDAAGTLLGSVTVPAGTDGELIGDFRYAPLGTVIVLVPNTSYALGGYTQGDDWGDQSASPGFNEPDFVGFTSESAIAHDGGAGFSNPNPNGGGFDWGACCAAVNLFGSTAPPSSSYATWASVHGASNNPAEDSNNDGVANGVAYFMNKTGLATNPGIDGTTKTVTWPNGGNIPKSAYGTQFVVQTSGDLQSWADVAEGALDSNTDRIGSVDGSLSYTLTGASPRFVRLKVTPN
ncbi:MAG: carboxypeptidase-like regulatory domain-containing protein [Verrucomicrobia bacterium]|nr:carboxypeptidase-like regulatory domain-containing protein [Verrucomicrobiota bacterium]